MARLSFRCDEDLVRLVDVARGDVARELWLRKAVVRAVEQALGPTGSDDVAPPRSVPAPAPAEQPAEDLMTRLEDSLRNVRSSQSARAGIRPIPKGK